MLSSPVAISVLSLRNRGNIRGLGRITIEHMSIPPNLRKSIRPTSAAFARNSYRHTRCRGSSGAQSPKRGKFSRAWQRLGARASTYAALPRLAPAPSPCKASAAVAAPCPVTAPRRASAIARSASAAATLRAAGRASARGHRGQLKIGHVRGGATRKRPRPACVSSRASPGSTFGSSLMPWRSRCRSVVSSIGSRGPRPRRRR